MHSIQVHTSKKFFGTPVFGLLLYIFILFASQLALAQPELDSTALNQLPGEHKKTKLLPLPYAGYLPETHFLAGGALLMTTRLSKDTSLAFSYTETDFTYTQNHQTIIENDMFLYLGHHYILKGLVGYESYPDKYWGIGNKSSSDSLNGYNSKRIFADLTFVRKINRHLYAGLKYRLFSMYNIEYLDGTNNLGNTKVTGYNGSFSNGLGLALIWDSRDNVLTTSTGTYIGFFNPKFGPFTLSDHTFTRYELDARHFIKLDSKNILAFQLVGNFVTGDAPFNMLAITGSDADMRGYYKGRYRDKDYLSIQAEYRRHLFWRIGMTAFVSAGDVNNNLANLFGELPKYSYGGGIRLKVNRKENINIRLDYAWGTPGNQGLYIYLAEAF
ncbi:MAG: hypothetical protein JWO58_91 [Chitinophagaceae bacterium]|nr:hypothetical protein [Chitinophagaceae bacterium]